MQARTEINSSFLYLVKAAALAEAGGTIIAEVPRDVSDTERAGRNQGVHVMLNNIESGCLALLSSSSGPGEP
jgi:hypothetical protein